MSSKLDHDYSRDLDLAVWRGKRVLVTGGAGFIGSHLVDALLGAGAEVRVLDDLSSGRVENLQAAQAVGRLEWVEGDIRDLAACQRAAEGVSHVFHQAARGSVPRSMADPATSLAINVSGTANVFAAARDAEVERVVYASSSSVYGEDPRLPRTEGQEGEPLSPYALSKAMNEELAQVFRRCYGMQIAGLRYFNVYGPRQSPKGPYAAVIPRFFQALVEGQAPVIYGDGGQSRDFTFVADAVRANLLAGSAPAAAVSTEEAVYNVGGGRGTTVLELASTIRDVVGSGPEAIHEPPRAGDVRASLADLARSTRALGYRPTVALEEGLQYTADDYLAPSVAEGEAAR